MAVGGEHISVVFWLESVKKISVPGYNFQTTGP